MRRWQGMALMAATAGMARVAGRASPEVAQLDQRLVSKCLGHSKTGPFPYEEEFLLQEFKVAFKIKH